MQRASLPESMESTTATPATPTEDKYQTAWKMAAEICKEKGRRAARQQKKDARKARQTEARASQHELGARIVSVLTANQHVAKLKVPQLLAILAHKAIECPKGAKKPELIALVEAALKLPTMQPVPPMPVIPVADDASTSVEVALLNPETSAGPSEMHAPNDEADASDESSDGSWEESINESD